MANQPNVLPDPPTPVPVQQDAEPLQISPEELAPIAEPVPVAACYSGRGNFLCFYLFALSEGLIMLRVQ